MATIKREKGGATHWAVSATASGTVTRWTPSEASAGQFDDATTAAVVRFHAGLLNAGTVTAVTPEPIKVAVTPEPIKPADKPETKHHHKQNS